MSSSDFNTIGNVVSTGTIIAIVIGSIGSIAFVIGTIVVIVCIVKHSNRRRNQVVGGMVLQQPYPYPQPGQNQYPYPQLGQNQYPYPQLGQNQYPYPQPGQNQYPPNTVSVANYPPPVQTGPAPYTASAPTYEKTPIN